MTYSYATINGQRVEENVAQAFAKLRAAFTNHWNLDLLVSSGTRTRAEQERLWNRWINRSPGATLAAAPGFSNHEENGPRGPRALDLRDSGRDAGVTVAGSARSNWLRENSPLYGFSPAGFSFSHVEPWHYEFNWALADGTVPAGTVDFSKTTKARQEFLVSKGFDLGPWGADGKEGPATQRAYVAYQKYLASKGWYSGPIDGIWGNGTQSGHKKHLASLAKPTARYPKVSVSNLSRIGNVQGLQKIARFGGYRGRIDNVWGRGSRAGFQTWLNANYRGSVSSWLRHRWGYVGDDYLGPVMTKALQKANSANLRAL